MRPFGMNFGLLQELWQSSALDKMFRQSHYSLNYLQNFDGTLI